MNKDVAFDTLQFANDTIFLGECNWTNLWSVKVILKGFKLVSNLRVNCSKGTFMALT